jgi:hypothetical protein
VIQYYTAYAARTDGRTDLEGVFHTLETPNAYCTLYISSALDATNSPRTTSAPMMNTNSAPSLYVCARRVRYREPVTRGRDRPGGRRGRNVWMSECGGGGDYQQSAKPINL